MIEGTTNKLEDLINQAMQKKKNKDVFPFALAVTATNITTCILVKNEKEFWFFDSHSKNNAQEKFAYVERFISEEALSQALKERYPVNKYLDNKYSASFLYYKK